MAITFSKQPLKFFNVNEPAIFEFTSDADLGVNQNDLVADLELKSLWTSRRYVIKNILPNYNTGVFRVDVQGYFKSLLLDNFNFRFENPNKQFSIEYFTVGISVHSENGADVLGDAYVFDSGLIFDETFIFAESVPSDNLIEKGYFPMVGLTHLSEKTKPIKNPMSYNILAPAYVEFAKGFEQTLSLFVGVGDATDEFISVDGVTSAIEDGLGVRLATISDAQIDKMYLPTLILPSLNNPNIKVYGISYKEGYCEDTLQFRFYNSYAGYSYFYTPKEVLTASRSKSEFINNSFYNQQDGRSSEVQRAVDYSEGLALTGTKPLELQELFRELLRSPKIEVLLDRGYTECKITGQLNVRKHDFEYSLNVDLANVNQISL